MCLTRRSENRILPVHSVKKCHSALVRSACKSNTPVAHNVHADSRAGSVWTVSALLPLRCPCVSQSVRVIRVVGVILQRFYLYNTCTDVLHATVSSEIWGVFFFFFFFSFQCLLRIVQFLLTFHERNLLRAQKGWNSDRKFVPCTVTCWKRRYIFRPVCLAPTYYT